MPRLDHDHLRLDAALNAARTSGSGRFDWLIRRHVSIVPRSIARRLPRFGAGVWFSFVFIDPRVIDAPGPAVRFLLAHEWGHVERGHIPIAFLALILGLTRVAISGAPPTLLTAFADLLVLGVIGYSLFGKSSARRELEADAFAVKALGRTEAAEAFRWLVDWRGQGWSPALRQRGDAMGIAR